MSRSAHVVWLDGANWLLRRRRGQAVSRLVGERRLERSKRLPAVHANNGRSSSPGNGSSHAKIADSRGPLSERMYARREKLPARTSLTASRKSAEKCIQRSPARPRRSGTGAPLNRSQAKSGKSIPTRLASVCHPQTRG